ncbi:MAG: ABC transporter substrate-binding protein, partial [Actinobacteria bacterium]
MNRGRSSAGAAWTAAGIVIAICLLSTFTLATPNTRRVLVSAPSPGANPTGGLPTALPGGKTYDCAKGQNAGPTDEGVTATEIRFAATTVESGPAKDFLKEAKYGMLAVANKVNRAGGVCGRQIKIEFRDDGWNPETGQRYIESFIGDHKYFGLAVNPSSEGLRGAIDSGLIRRSGFPVIGADGMLYDQYKDPWVWPVATSTASVMHIMAANAYARGARTFGIAWETSYRFGKEGHDAFVGEVKR